MILRLVILSLCFFSASTLSSQAKSTLEGSWRYTVKVKDTTKFNKKEFLARYKGIKLTNPPKMRNTFGGKKLQLNDTYYTGYFHLSSKEGESKEIIGTYNPFEFVLPNEYIPIRFLNTKEIKEDDSYVISWYTNFRDKSVLPEDVIWLTEAYYKNGATKIHGYTAALRCKKDNNCSLMNFVKWNAEKITNIKYYTKENHRWKPLLAKVIRFFDPTGSLEKAIFNKFFNKKSRPSYEYFRDANRSIFVKDNYRAVLPAKALATTPDPALQAICSPDYCGDTAKFWPPKTPGDPSSADIQPTGSNAQERAYNDLLNRQAYCDQAVSGRRSLCCNPIASGGGESTLPSGEPSCECTEQTTGSPSSARCCKVSASCQEERTTVQANGAIDYQVTNTNYDHTNTTDAQRFSIMGGVDSFMGGQFSLSNQNTFSGMPFSFNAIALFSNTPITTCGGLPCGGPFQVLPTT